MTPVAGLEAEAVSRLDEPGWWTLRWVQDTDSTNRQLLMSSGAPEGTVLVAEHQTSGRGRLDRRWEAATASSLLCSVLVRPSGEAAKQKQLLTIALALGLCDAAHAVGVEAVVKWPNDVGLSNGGQWYKLAGILAEATAGSVVLGFGLNVVVDDSRPPTATYLEAHASGNCSRPAILADVLNGFQERYLMFTEDGPEALLFEFRDRCDTLGRMVRVEQQGGSWRGRATGIDADGSLLVERSTGVQAVSVGDIVHLHRVD